MFKLYSNALLLVLWVPLCDTLEQSRYVKTQMFLEPKTCQNDPFNRRLVTFKAMTEIYCSVFCTQHPDCRRLMFDRKTKKCTLFQSGENCISDVIIDKVCFRQLSICSDSKCTRCPIGYHGDRCENIIQDCTDGEKKATFPPKEHLLSYIQPSGEIIEVMCNSKYGLTIIQNREMDCSEVNFNKSWEAYASGFGQPYGDYWLGLQHIYDILQNHHSFVLALKLKLDGIGYQSYYNNFKIADESNDFRYSSDTYSPGDDIPTGDSMTATLDIRNQRFSTYDRDNSGHNCPNRFNGGWWYVDNADCSQSNLNGKRNGSNFESTIHWSNDKGTRTDFEYVLIWIDRKSPF